MELLVQQSLIRSQEGLPVFFHLGQQLALVLLIAPILFPDHLLGLFLHPSLQLSFPPGGLSPGFLHYNGGGTQLAGMSSPTSGVFQAVEQRRPSRFQLGLQHVSANVTISEGQEMQPSHLQKVTAILFPALQCALLFRVACNLGGQI